MQTRFIPLTVFLLLLIPLSLWSQSATRLQAVVHLKDGSILRGDILEQSPEGNIKIEIIGKNILVYAMDQVEKITYEPPVSVRTKRAPRQGTPTIKNKGYYGLGQFGLLIGGSRDPWGGYYHASVVPSFLFVQGHQFNRFLAVGGGLSLDISQQGPVMPLFAEVRGDILNRSVTPHYYVQGGYNQPLYGPSRGDWVTEERVFGGPMAAAGAGLRFHSRGTISHLVSLGYRYQTSGVEYLNQGGVDVREVHAMQRMSVQYALMF